MPTPTQPQILARLFALVQAACPNAKVYDHVVYPEHGRDEEFFAICAGADGLVNCVFINWTDYLRPETTENDDIVSEKFVYRMRMRRGIVTEYGSQIGAQGATPSRTQFNADVLAVIDAINADNELELGAGVSHDGIYTTLSLDEREFNGRLCHDTELGLDVLVQPCD